MLQKQMIALREKKKKLEPLVWHPMAWLVQCPLASLASFYVTPYSPTHTNSLCPSHANLLLFPGIYSITSHIITSPCNILFSTPKFPLRTPTYPSGLKSLPSLTSHLSCSLMAPSTFAPEHIPCWWVDLSDYLSHVCLLHETVSFRTVTVSLTNKKYSMCFKIEVIFQNLIIENYETSVSVYFQCFPTFLLYKYFQTSLKS